MKRAQGAELHALGKGVPTNPVAPPHDAVPNAHKRGLGWALRGAALVVSGLTAHWFFAEQMPLALHWPASLRVPRPSPDVGFACALAVMALMGLLLALWMLRQASDQRLRAAALAHAMASMSATPKALPGHPSPWPPLTLPTLPDPAPPVPQAPEAAACENQPRLLAELGLATALQAEINLQTWPGQPSRAVLQMSMGSALQRLPRAVELAAFWMAREALCNALNPAHVSAVVVFLDIRTTGLRMEVHDIGHGVLGPSVLPVAGAPFAPKTSWPRDLDQHPSVTAMRHRALEVGARLTLRSEPQQGTRIILRWQA
jgi:hypothetical protein